MCGPTSSAEIAPIPRVEVAGLAAGLSAAMTAGTNAKLARQASGKAADRFIIPEFRRVVGQDMAHRL
jgi:hypothetical protein